MEKYHFFKEYNILCVEDDEVTLNYLETILNIFFKKVIVATNGEDAYKKVKTEKIDIILTDIYMPNVNGITFIKRLRNENCKIPVIFLSACSDKETLLSAIPLRIYSYLVKPVVADEILKELFDAMQQIQSTDNSNKNLFNTIDGISVNIRERNCKKEGKSINLTKKEFELLELFLVNNKSVLSKDFIEENLWSGNVVAESSVKTLMKKLRAKIGENTITTITNLGYKIELDLNR